MDSFDRSTIIAAIEANKPTISRRDYFAGMALQGLLANGAENSVVDYDANWEKEVARLAVARLAVDYADAMIEELGE